MNTLRLLPLMTFLTLLYSCSANENEGNTEVFIKTTVGDITIRLYEETPVHHDNFINLVSSGFYDGIPFHRVINGFMIQAGDGSLKAGRKNKIDTLDTYTLPSEFRTEFIHKKGALAAARQGNNVNPLMRSSGTQFYLVHGKKYSDAELTELEEITRNSIRQCMFIRFIREISDSCSAKIINLNEAEIQERASLRLFDNLAKQGEYKMTDAQKNIYKTLGGVPYLDGTYTVFGEVTKGLEIIDIIAGAKTDNNDRPLSDILIIRMKVLKH